MWGGGSPFKGWINLEKGPTAQFVMICAQLRKNRPQLMSTIVEKEGGGGVDCSWLPKFSSLYYNLRKRAHNFENFLYNSTQI